MPHIAHISLLVRDYDEAIDFYVRKLGFVLVEDNALPEANKRWVTISPPAPSPSPPAPSPATAAARWSSSSPPRDTATTTILLARAASEEQLAAVGRQAGGRVFLFLETDDFARDHDRFTRAGVRWVRPPAEQAYGVVAVFEDLYGNRWDLIQRKVPR